MPKMIKGILIDPFNQTITEVEVEKSNINDIYKLLQCNYFDVVYIEHSDAIYVDDEGLLGDMSEQKFFMY